MAISLITAADVIEYLGLDSTVDTTGLASICAGLASEVKRYCRWKIVEADYSVVLPRVDTALGMHNYSANYLPDRNCILGERNKLQLPCMWVTSVDSVYEDVKAKGGQGSDDFPSTTLLTYGTDYFLEYDGGHEDTSEAGMLVRVGKNWPSIPLTIKVEFTGGLTENQLAGEHYGLRFRLVQRCCELWFERKRQVAAYVSGLGGDTSGLLRSEKLGDYAVSWASPDAAGGGGGKGGSPGLLGGPLEEFLTTAGYVAEWVPF